jgi:hypothetical protein
LIIDVLQRSFRDELVKWAKDESTVEVMQTFKACVTDFTTGWLFSIEARTDWLHNKSDANYFYEIFERSGGAFFWRGEFYETLSLLLKFGIRIDPKKADDAQQNLRKWSNGMCLESLKAADALRNDSTKNEDTKHKPSVCSELRAHLWKTEKPETAASFSRTKC